ncbi:MAG: SH3 domain-containing protein [Acidobacteriota bacterium]
MSKRGLGLVLLVSLVAEVALASDAGARFVKGVEAYEQQRPLEAERIFRELLSEGHEDATLLFNLGNASYRRGRHALAVVAYEWALRLDPTDEEVRSNLEMARAHLVTDEVPDPRPPWVQALLELPQRWSLSATWWCFAAAWTLGWSCLALALLRMGKGLGWVALALLVVSLVIALPLVARVQQVQGPDEGVLLWPEVTVRSGPGEDYAELFGLHSGTLVDSLESRPGWRRIRFGGGLEGWVPASALAIIGRPDTLPPMRDQATLESPDGGATRG